MILSSIGLNTRNMFINCNPCPYNRMLWGKCKGLYQQKARVQIRSKNQLRNFLGFFFYINTILIFPLCDVEIVLQCHLFIDCTRM